MADCAVKAIKAFFDQYDEFSTPKVCAAYTTWAVPEPEEHINENGQKSFVPPQLYPYMWQVIDESDPEHPVCYIYSYLMVLICCLGCTGSIPT